MSRWTLCGVSLVAALRILVACAHGQDDVDLGGDGVADPDGGGDTRAPSRDGGSLDGSKADPDSSSGGDPGCTSKVVINELMAGAATAADEFVELYNTGSCTVSLSGWKLAYKSKAGTGNPTPFHDFTSGESIEGQSFFVLGTSTFNGQKDATMSGGMAAQGGQVGLLDDKGDLVDALGYGGATGDYVEGTAASAPPDNGSVGRKSDGLDTDKNSVDCKVFSKHTAGASNQ